MQTLVGNKSQNGAVVLTRRWFLWSSMAAGLTACQTTSAPIAPSAAPKGATLAGPGHAKTGGSQSEPAVAKPADTGPNLSKALTPGDTQDFRITEVRVRLAQGFRRNMTQNGVSDAQILRAMSASLAQGLSNANAKGQTPVRAEVEITDFAFAGDATLLLGNASSSVGVRTTLYFAGTDQPVGRGVDVRGYTARMSGMIGAAMIKSPAQEVQLVATALPGQIRQRLYGRNSGS
ncbi:hypothetical protein O4H61_11930 [Roseovarius aestuarii]|nr:hypothetical protein [Roseovarius aestuarii]